MGAKRITLNTAVTYLQTAVSIVVGFFYQRWIFNALGEEQYGLFGVVGALISFVGILNVGLMNSSGRFFAFALGQQRRPDGDKELLCKWFNTALSVQFIIPIVLTAIGGPIGVYAIHHWLEKITIEMRDPCVTVFLISLFTMFQTMLFSPVQSLYLAKQYIYVRNIIAIFQTFLMAVAAWWLLHYGGNRFIAHALLSATILVVVSLAFVLFAALQFPEAKLRPRYWFDKKRLRELFSFTTYSLIDSLGQLFSNSWVEIVLNNAFGATANAATSVGGQISQKSAAASGAFMGAVYPEIHSRVGAGDMANAMNLAIKTCAISIFLTLLVAFPYAAYSQRILTFWLVKPPEAAAPASVILISILLSERFTHGYHLLISASGKIKLICTLNCVMCFIRFAIVWVCVKSGIRLVPALWLGLFAPSVLMYQYRILFAKYAAGVSIRRYLTATFAPLALAISVSFAFSFGFKHFAGESIPAILTCVASNAVLMMCLFWAVIGKDERARISRILKKIRERLR